MIRIAAVGDVHAGTDTAGTLAPGFVGIEDHADVLLIAGDITKCGTPAEAEVFAKEIQAVSIPKVAVLGNHDHHAGQPGDVEDALRDHGIDVLEGSSLVLDVAGERLGIAGAKGFGGGFAGASATAFGEPEMKAFVEHTQMLALRLGQELAELAQRDCDHRVALLHYAPVADTVAGERLEIYPFLGSEHLAEAIDANGADLVLHGHAHAGTEHGTTPCGIPVRNVAMPVIRCAYRVYSLGASAPRLAASAAR